MKHLKNIFMYLVFGCLCFLIMPLSVQVSAASVYPSAQHNLGSGLIEKSYMTATDSGYMRVFYDGQKIGIEYYDDSLNIQSKKSLEMELDIWGGFYKGSDAYYIVEGKNNTAEDDTAEVVRVIKYDTKWNKTGSASITGNTSLFGGEVRYPFDYGCVQMTEYNGTLYIVTGHEGYVDPTYNQGHQGFLMIAVNESTMQGKIVKSDLWHSFAQYIENNGSDLYVLEQSEGSRYTKLTRYDTKTSNMSATSFAVLEYGGSRTSAWAIPCYASVDGMAVSSGNVLGLGTSIDQSDYDNVTSDTAHNIYLTVTPMSNFSGQSTTVKWLTDYSGNSKCFYGVKITKVNSNRFMISWEESYSDDDDRTVSDKNDLLSGNTLHYIFVDGSGNKLTREFTARASISDCQPVVKGSQIVFYSSSASMIDFYTINTSTGAFGKKVYRVAGEKAVWEFGNNTLTISGSGAVSIDAKSRYTYPVSSVSGSYSYSSSDNVWKPIREDVQKIVIKRGITSIPENEFKYFDNLQEVEIEWGLKSIGKEAFSNCNTLSKITIPSTVKEIGDDILWTGYYWVSDYSHVVRASIYAAEDSYAASYAKQNSIKLVAVEEKLVNESTLSSSNVFLGSSIKVKASAIGGKGSYTYAVLYKKDDISKWTVKQNYSKNATVTIQPETTGKYEVCVKVKDSSGNIEKKYLNFTATEALKNNSVLSATSISYGSTVSVRAYATGGSGSYTYAVLYRRAGTSKWTTSQNYSTNKTVTIKPAAVTNYEVCVKVKDSNGNIAKKYLTFTVKALENNSTLSSTSISYGSTVNVKASATGGTGSYTYAVLYRKVGTSKWTVSQNYSTNKTITIKPAASTKYEVCVKVKDSSGAIAKKYFNFNVK